MKTTPSCASCAAFDREPGLCRRTSPGPAGFPAAHETDWCLQHQPAQKNHASALTAAGWRESWGDPDDLMLFLSDTGGATLADIAHHLGLPSAEDYLAFGTFLKTLRNLAVIHQSEWVFSLAPTRAELEAMRAEKTEPTKKGGAL